MSLHELDDIDDVSRWNDGTLRATRLGVNGLPELDARGEDPMPDELFLGPVGDQVEILRTRDGWEVKGPGGYDTAHTTTPRFDIAFVAALRALREVVER